ncbi:MAG: metal ABC transporter substrate-binding protein [Opitutaceae bacterium]|jgi:zinc/manganese transport system substrate-binding protein|nr:metal ABC transporter substrate-binding protein [Opitutaceae bacterium]
MKKYFPFILFILSTAAAQQPLKIASLHPVLTGLAREIGGDLVTVTSVLPSGVDPHLFEPSAVDLRAIVNADLTLAAGLGLESYLDRLAARAGAPGKILSAGDTLPENLLLCPGARDHAAHAAGCHHHSHAATATTGDDATIPHSAFRIPHSALRADPHWWQSIDCVSFIAGRIGDEFARLRPEAAGAFARNTRACRQRLSALKTWAGAEIARIPPARRHLVTSHDAFGYLARDYGFEIHSLSGLSTDSEPDARRLAVLIKLIREKKIPAVFTENNASPRVIANLVSETGARTGGTLHADGPGPADGDAATYEAMYRHNIRTLVAALATGG